MYVDIYYFWHIKLSELEMLEIKKICANDNVVYTSTTVNFSFMILFVATI